MRRHEETDSNDIKYTDREDRSTQSSYGQRSEVDCLLQIRRSNRLKGMSSPMNRYTKACGAKMLLAMKRKLLRVILRQKLLLKICLECWLYCINGENSGKEEGK